MSKAFESSEVIETGPVFITAKASKKLNPLDVFAAVQWHRWSDWGLVCEADKEANDIALNVGHRMVSAHCDRNEVRFWIVTEPDRSYTTVLLTTDY